MSYECDNGGRVVLTYAGMPTADDLLATAALMAFDQDRRDTELYMPEIRSVPVSEFCSDHAHITFFIGYDDIDDWVTWTEAVYRGDLPEPRYLVTCEVSERIES